MPDDDNRLELLEARIARMERDRKLLPPVMVGLCFLTLLVALWLR